MFISFLTKGVGWSSFYELEVGYKISFNTDKTNKSADVVLITGEVLPKLYKNQFVILSQETTLTFNADGTPKNHWQFLLDFAEVGADSDTGKAQVKITLKDVIEYFRGFQTSNISFTNQTEKTVKRGSVQWTLKREKFNYYTALRRLFTITHFNNAEPTDFVSVENLNNQIHLLDYDFLQGIDFADETLSASDIYTILMSYDDILDRMPEAYFDFNFAGRNGTPQYVGVQEVNIDVEESGDSFKPIANYYTDFRFSISGKAFQTTGDLYDSIDYRRNVFYSTNLSGTELYEFQYKELNYNAGADTWFIKADKKTFISEVVATTGLRDLNTPRFLLKFKRRDGFDKDTISLESIKAGAVKVLENIGGDDFAEKVQADMNNLHANTRAVYPYKNLWIAPQFDSDERDVPVDENAQKDKWYIEVPAKIKRVINISVMTITFNPVGNGTKRQTANVNPDLILEDKEYKTSELYVTNKGDLYHYSEGDNRLYINPYVSKNDNVTRIYQIEYEPLINTLLQVGEGNYTGAINQSNSQADSLKFTAFLNQYLKSMKSTDLIIGRVEGNLAEVFSRLNARVEQNDNLDDDYIISNIAIQNTGDLFIAVYQLNMSNYKRNLNVRHNNAVRANRAIEYENLQDRKNIYKQVITINQKPETTAKNNSTLLNKDTRAGLLYAFFSGQVKDVQIAYIKGGGANALISPLMQVNKNQIQYNLIIDSSAFLGYRKETNSPYATGQDVKRQLPVLYTNPLGEVERADIIFTYLDRGEYADTDFTIGVEATRTATLTWYSLIYPYVDTSNDTELLANKVFEFKQANIYKDMLEKFNIAFAFELESENVIFCENLLKYSGLIGDYKKTNSLKSYLYDKLKSEGDSLDGSLGNYTFSKTNIDTANGQLFIPVGNAGAVVDGVKSVIVTSENGERLLIIQRPQFTTQGGKVGILLYF